MWSSEFGVRGLNFTEHSARPESQRCKRGCGRTGRFSTGRSQLNLYAVKNQQTTAQHALCLEIQDQKDKSKRLFPIGMSNVKTRPCLSHSRLNPLLGHCGVQDRVISAHHRRRRGNHPPKSTPLFGFLRLEITSAGVPQRFSSLLLPHSRRPGGRFGPRARAWSAKFCHRFPLALPEACPCAAWVFQYIQLCQLKINLLNQTRIRKSSQAAV